MVDIEIACEDGTWLQRAVLELAVVLPPFTVLNCNIRTIQGTSVMMMMMMIGSKTVG
jgi:hypothetical protein